MSSSADLRKDSTLDPLVLFQKAVGLSQVAEEMGLQIRLVGGLGIASLLRGDDTLFDFLIENRRTKAGDSSFGDIDFVCTSKGSRLLNDYFVSKLDFQKDKIVNSLFGDARRIYYDPNSEFHIDVFIDKLEFNHTIDVRDKIGLSGPHLYAPDLLLSKLQIHFINEKDLLDILAALSTEALSSDGALAEISSVLSDDWGFETDAMNNLMAAKQLAEDIRNRGLFDTQKVEANIDRMISAIHSHEKSRAWQKRSKKGTKKQWWQDVEEVLR